MGNRIFGKGYWCCESVGCDAVCCERASDFSFLLEASSFFFVSAGLVSLYSQCKNRLASDVFS